MFGEMVKSAKYRRPSDDNPSLADMVGLLETLAEENLLLRAVIDNFPGGILLYDKNLRLVLCNEKQKKLLDYPPALFEYGLPTLEQIFRFNALRGEYGPGDIEAHVAERMALAAKRAPHVFERVRPNGTVLEVRGTPLEGGGFVTMYLDITAQRSRNAEATAVKHAKAVDVNHDALTGLPNRVIVDDRFQQILTRVRRGHVAAVHFIDLDHYKAARQKLGKKLGDLLLQMVAGRLLNVARSADTVARIGEDEFILLQTDVDRPSSVAKLSHRIVEAVKRPYTIDKCKILLQASVGISLAPRDGLDADGLIAKAREALDRSRHESGEQEMINN